MTVRPAFARLLTSQSKVNDVHSERSVFLKIPTLSTMCARIHTSTPMEIHVHMCVHKNTHAHGSLHTGTYTDNYRWHGVLPLQHRHTTEAQCVTWKYLIERLET